MPTTPHSEDPAEGSRETIDRELKRTEADQDEAQATEGGQQKERGARNEDAARAPAGKP
ncbi:MAG TPA: hypothetical protein VNS34_05690 [Rhizobiaceae bacterium]|nr:hypothetical protein [Rhizobiaceae bacterium]